MASKMLSDASDQFHTPRASSLKRQARVFHTNAPPPTVQLGNSNVSVIIDEVHNDTIDSVFYSLADADATSIQKEIEILPPDEPRPARFALYSDGTAAVCRICHSGEKSCPFSTGGEPLISPCHCRGTTGLYHRTCLERWLSASNKDKCEICKFQYRVEREPKKLLEFILKPGSKSIRRHMISDLICWFILTPTAAVGTWLCLSGALHRTASSTSTAKTDDGFDRVKFPTLIGLATFLLMTYFIWSVICLRYHIRIFHRWQLRNYRVRIVLDTDNKRKRRFRPKKQPPPSPANSNNNTGSVREAVRTPDRSEQGAIRGGGASSSDTVGTRYSSPWPAVHRQLPRDGEEAATPGIYWSPEHGGSYAPASPSPMMREIYL